MSKKNFLIYAMAAVSTAALTTGCDKSGSPFSLAPDSSSYKQEAVYVPKKIDVLWVIDNSGSMETSQQNLATNFQSFINRFQQNNYDFNMAVVTTDAWRKEFNANSELARIRDGAVLQRAPYPHIENHSGVFVMNNNTPDLSNVFSTNIKQGTLGDGDERAIESMKQSLLDSFNVSLNFRRPEAFLAVIIVSDEEDFSHSSSSMNESYSNAGLRSVQSYVNFMDSYTGGTASGRNYSISTISVPDDACKTQLSSDGFQRKIATRLHELTALTGGVKGSLCTNFGTTLTLISDTIIQLSSSFKLQREPLPETIVVTVNGSVVLPDATNGWTYDAAKWTVTFHGNAVPPANASVRIAFDPKTIKQ
ncbi:hypothetical protein D3C87_445600 [compost metagenome]